MGDAVRRVQKHLQELSRDHLTSVEDRHHANLGWLQVSLQQLCKQIEVDVRVELTRPPRLSFSKPLPPFLTNNDAKTDTNTSTTTTSANAKTRVEDVKAKASTRLEFDAMVDEEPPRASKKQREEEPPTTEEDVVEMEIEEPTTREQTKKTETIMVKKMRKVLKPKKIVTKVKTLVKKPKAELPVVDVGALKVVDLKNELKKRGLKQSGVKAVLVARLKEALAAEDAAIEEEEVEEEVEIVEEIMEEVDEEYDEEVEVADEKEHEEHVDAADEVEVIDVDEDDDEEISMPTREAPKSKRAENKELPEAEAEAARMSMEDEDVVFIGTSGADTLDTKSAMQDTQIDRNEPEKAVTASSSSKKSLSDMVSPPSADEIVRESDLGSEGLMSPEGRAFVASVVSAQKSPAKTKPVASAAAAVAVRKNPVKAPSKTDDIIATKEVPAETTNRDATVRTDKPTAKLQAARHQPSVSSDNVAPVKQLTSADANVEDDSATKEAPANEKKEVNAPEEPLVRSKPQSAAAALSSSVLAKTMAATDRALKAAAAAAAAAAEHTAKTASATNAPVNPPTVTPAREILARLKSLTPGATSDRSSSGSSYTASRRYAGNTNFVEDSQPDQSPHPHVSFAPDAASQSTRAASSSQLEIQAIASKMKTPDSTSGAILVNERVAHSEPRVNAAKQQVVDEAERKRQEQQESIQREAQRLRLAAKQSARKRFEEAKSSNLLWAKRDQTPTGSSAPSSSTTQRSESTNSSTPITPTSSIDSTPATSASSTESASVRDERPEKNAAAAKETAPVQVTKAPAPAAAAPVMKASQLETAKRPAASATTKAAEVPAKKDPEPTKRVLQSRKRSSIAIDTSASTLYPSKKRTSITRAKDVVSDPPAAKRTSLTKEKTAEVPRKRSSSSREAPAVEATKRRRSSETRDKPAPVSTTNKRTSITSKRSSITSETSAKSTTRSIPTIASRSAAALSRRDSASSTISSSSNISTSESRSKTAMTSVMAGGAVRKPANLVSGLHSFTSLLEKDSNNLSSSQGSNTSSSSRAPGVSALKLAEKSRLLEQKKNLEKAKRKEALAKRYEEQRKADEEKRKKAAQMKEKAERDARLKREQEQAAEKKQRDLELAKKRQQRLQEMRSGMEKKKDPPAAVPKTSATVAPVSRVAASTSSTSSSVAVQPTKAAAGKGAASKELTTYAMSEHEESESEGSGDEKDTKRNDKNIPKWAQREHLERTLKLQFGPNAVDPTPSIFPDFIDSCDLEAIFEPTDVRKKKRFQRRTSSGNWLADRPTAREKAIYKRDMGFQR